MSLRLAIALAVLTLGPASAADQTPASTYTFSRADWLSDAGARGIVTADFDNDGSPDFATANTGSNTVDVFINRQFAGSGFTVARYAVGAGPFDIASADVNYDGYPDLFVAAADADEIDVLLGGVGGVFQAPQRLPAPGNPRGIAVGWVGACCGYSVVYSSYTFGTVTLLNYDYSSNSFTPGVTLKAGANPQGVAIGRFKPEGGYPDIAVANAGGSPITLLLGNADGSFTRSTLPGATNMNVLVVADFNHDGRHDLAAASTAQNFVALFMNSTAGLQYSGKLSGSMIASPRGIAAIDLTADGRPELMVGNRASNSVTIFTASSSGSTVFSTFQTVPAGPGARAVAGADFDGDGRVDLATGNDLAKAATVLWNRTTRAGGSGATAWELHALPDATADTWAAGGPYAVADFNHNGLPDIVVGNGIVLDAKSARTVDVGRLYPNISAAIVGDFDEDGHTDLGQATSYYTQNGTQWTSHQALDFLKGDGGGGFTLGASVPLTTSFGVVAGDFNRDGHLDAVVFDKTDQSETSKTLLGKGDGTFTEIDRSITQGQVLRAATDLNGDGKLDLLVYNAWSQQVGFYLGDGAGKFGTEHLLPPVNGVSALQAADINGDGHVDAIALRTSSIVVWPGNGDGTFDDPMFSDLPNYPYWIAVADFTGDGHLDVFTSEGTLAVGRGDGTFGPNRTIKISTTAALVADIDRDGLPDLFVGTYDYTAMALYNRTTEPANAAPVVKIWPERDISVPFASQFGEDGLSISAAKSYDPNLDPLSFVWLENEQVIATGTTLYGNFASGTHRVTLVVRDNAGAERRASRTITIQPYQEIVIYAAELGAPHGAWTRTPDTTAAGGVSVSHPNANAAKVANAVANPTNYIDVGFPADPTQEYKVWIRLKAQGNSPFNDSVFIQFDNAIDAAGNKIYPTGTTSALSVNLEECSGCGLSGWGWRDEAWGTSGATGTVTVRFPAPVNRSMWHTMRIQTREDGVTIDQIVLSSNKYRTTRPGAVKNDGTILIMTVPFD